MPTTGAVSSVGSCNSQRIILTHGDSSTYHRLEAHTLKFRNSRISISIDIHSAMLSEIINTTLRRAEQNRISQFRSASLDHLIERKHLRLVAIILAEFMPGVDDTDLRSHCVQHFRPEFSARAKNGSRVIVTEYGFGSGSLQEDPVRALQGGGVEPVI
ncbi:hypothetical protein HG530_013215 [Fusarium avenaceum]|nr:hypothetical protein HG530_013215 [Fusarium avenaceum]